MGEEFLFPVFRLTGDVLVLTPAVITSSLNPETVEEVKSVQLHLQHITVTCLYFCSYVFILLVNSIFIAGFTFATFKFTMVPENGTNEKSEFVSTLRVDTLPAHSLNTRSTCSH